MRSRLPLALLAALVVFAVPAGSALATAGAFTAPAGGATISQGQTFTVDANGVAGATQVLFYDEETDPTSGVTSTRFEGSGTETSPGSGIYTWQAQVGGWTNPTTGDNAPYGITFDAVIADLNGNPIETLYKTVTIDNNVDPLTVASVAPASGSTVSGTFTLSVTPSDPNNTVTSGDYSIEGGGTGTLVSDGHGHFTASINTVADGIPNGDVYIDVHLMDAPGNQGDNSAHILHLVVASPQAPAITPGTLVADKALYRTAETQLEVGDKVEVYGMQADGFPAPVIHYLWNVCRGQVCNGVTPGQDGLYTIQPADEGATLTLVATASNASGTDFTTVGFGAIGPAYVEPVVDPTPEPVVTPPVAPPVVAPPVVTPPVVTPPVDTTAVTPAEQRALTVAQNGVTADTKAVVKAVEAKKAAEQAAVVATKKADVAIDKVAAANATATEKKQVVLSVTSLIDVRVAFAKKMAAAKAAAVKAAEEQAAADKAAAVAASKLVVAKKQAATGTATKAEKKTLAAATQQSADAKASAAEKNAAADAAAAKEAATRAAAARLIAVAGKKVDTAITVVSAGTATATDKKQVVEKVTTSVVARTVAADKSDAAAEAAKKLAAAKSKFAAQQAAAVK